LLKTVNTAAALRLRLIPREAGKRKAQGPVLLLSLRQSDYRTATVAGSWRSLKGRPKRRRSNVVVRRVKIILTGAFVLAAMVLGASVPSLALELTQETEQEAESGDVDQTFEVTSEGDNSNQCAGVQGVSNTGNPQNVTDLLQAESEADEFEFEEVGSDITVSPESPTTCDQKVNQAASASG
jgi:multisubunit Na+/H+ antiporter MnhC subunit